MNLLRRNTLGATLALATGGASWRGALAQATAYPSKAIRVLVPFPPGIPLDVIMRVRSEEHTSELQSL